MKLLFIGDIVGRPGRDLVQKGLRGLVEHFGVDRILVGHTIVPTIPPLYGGKVIAVQVYPRRDEAGQARFESLLIRNGELRRAHQAADEGLLGLVLVDVLDQAAVQPTGPARGLARRRDRSGAPGGVPGSPGSPGSSGPAGSAGSPGPSPDEIRQTMSALGQVPVRSLSERTKQGIMTAFRDYQRD